MGPYSSRRLRALLGLAAVALTTGCPPVLPPDPGPAIDQEAERKAIVELLGDSAIAAHFPSRLINDGVGIFSMTDEVPLPTLPRRWGRSYAQSVQGIEAKPADSMSLSVSSATEAKGAYQHARAGKLVLDYTWQKKLLSKPFVENTQRTALFRKVKGIWTLESVSVSQVKPETSELRAGDIALSIGGQPIRRFKSDAMLAVGDLPVALPDQDGRIEIQLSSEAESTDPTFHAFLHVPPMTQRLLLRDDGQLGDVKANDGVYTTRFNFPSQPGLRYLVIDAIAGKTFADPAMTNYDAIQWGVPYRVQGGEAR